METKYKYIGKGDALYHVPTRDLTEQDIAERAETWKEFGITESLLVNSGLYRLVDSGVSTADWSKKDVLKLSNKKSKGSLDAVKDGE